MLVTEKGKKVYDIKAIPKDVQIHTGNPFVSDVQRKQDGLSTGKTNQIQHTVHPVCLTLVCCGLVGW